MTSPVIEAVTRTPTEKQRVEVVERKGVGHPDTMCDAIMEQLSLALCQEYLSQFGRILHHNLDKGLLVAGRTEPQPGGGRVLEPMRLVFGDRATMEVGGRRINAGALAEATSHQWIREHLRFVDPTRHLVLQNELRAGSPELVDIFARPVIGANDTSAAVGYAPLTETEQLVLAAERFINSEAFKRDFPETGEDVKVMGYRRDRQLALTIAIAFVDRFIPDPRRYFARKEEIRAAIASYLEQKLEKVEQIAIHLNTLDNPARGQEGMYLTVLGTSAEGADGGQVGRGNRTNGVISLNRPMSTEAPAGKNPVSHVGKIYTLLTHRIAAEIYQRAAGVEEVYFWLASQIGQPVDEPAIVSAQLVLQPGVFLEDVEPAVAAVIHQELAAIPDFTARLARGEFPVW